MENFALLKLTGIEAPHIDPCRIGVGLWRAKITISPPRAEVRIVSKTNTVVLLVLIQSGAKQAIG